MWTSPLALAHAGLALFFAGSARAAAWHMDTLQTLAIERLDPVVSPNVVSGHMHEILGGSAFGAAYNYQDQIAGSCTSASISADHSNYWMPKLYWINADNSFVPLPTFNRFYYFLGRNSPNETVAPFPEGLKMIIGSPTAKTAGTPFGFTCIVNSDLQTGNIASDNFNYNRDCPYGLKIESKFPSCWDGVNLYKSDMSHMAYPGGYNSPASWAAGQCPWSHPIRIPMIMLEYTYRPSAWSPGVALAGNLAWANGDTTGYGVHADFINGWDTNILATALNNTQCAGGDNAFTISDCEVLAPYYNANPNCSPDKGQMNEPGSQNLNLVPIPALPGCNPIWGTGAQPACTPTAAPDVSHWQGSEGSLVATGSQNKALVLPTTPGWKSIGCVKNGNAMLTGGYSFYDDNLSVTTCGNTCLKAGYQYSMLGLNANNRWDCQCGTGVDPDATVYPGMCNSPCPGNSTQTCGGSNTHGVYYAASGTTFDYSASPNVTVSNPSYMGCYSATGSTSLTSKVSFSYSATDLTTAACLQVCTNHNATWGMTTAGKTCMCGNDYAIGSGQYIADSSCNMPCAGAANETCGQLSAYSVYNVTQSGLTKAVTNYPPDRQGCFLDNGMLGLTAYSWTSGAMTVESCVYGCADLGYALAGLTFGNRCRCGNTWAGGALYPNNQCTTACTGNATETCGNSYKTEVYSTTTAMVQVKKDVAARPVGWLGCINNYASSALTSYNGYDGSLTVERCIATCNTYGYAYAGMQNGNYCRCSNTNPMTVATPYPSNVYCTSPCPGNKTETCGNYGGVADTYSVQAYLNASSKAAAGAAAASASGLVGCYNGITGLSSAAFSSNVMTVDMCTMGCKEMGYGLAGISGPNCYCGNSWTGGSLLPNYQCTTTCPGNTTQTCGGYNIESVYNSSVGLVNPAYSQSGYVGCFGDASSPRTLNAYSYSSNVMTNAACRATCAGQGYLYAGTENGNQCYCGNTLTGNPRTTTTYCASTCAGDSSKICGGSWKLSVFNASTTSTTPSASASGSAASNATSSGVKAQGCYTDGSTLNQNTYSSGYMTVDQCVSYCKGLNFAYAGLTNGNQCGCGNTSPKAIAGNVCTVPCVSNSKQMCGGTSYTSVYPTTTTGLIDAFSAAAADSTGYMGCWQDAQNRALTGQGFTSNTMTVITCRANCLALGNMFSMVEYGSQCQCGDGISAGKIRYADSVCSYKCAGDATQTCGGYWAGNVRVHLNSTSTATVSSSASATVSGNSTASGSGSAATSVPTSAAIEGYKGCYGTGNFVSSTASYSSSNAMSVGFCRRFCRANGFAAAALQGGNNCYCGAMTDVGTKTADSGCNSACSGDNTANCGSLYLASVYDTVGAGATSAPGFPANYVGCFQDSSSGRTLSGWGYTSSAMQSSICKASCSAKGYSIWGTESGNQCYCGPSLPPSMVTDNICSNTCAGNSSEMCGGSWKLSVYSLNFATSAGDPASGSSGSSASASASASKNATVSVSASKSATSSVVSSKAASSVVVSSTSKAASVSASSKAASVSASSSKAASVSASSSKAASVSASPSKAVSSAVASPSKAASSAVASPSKAASSAVASSKAASSAVASSAAASPSKAASSAVASSKAASSSAAASPVGGGLAASPKPASSSAAASSAASSKAASSAVASSKAASSASAASSTSKAASTTSKAASSSAAAASSSTSKAVSSAAAASSKASTAATSTTTAAPASATNHLGCYTQSASSAVLDKSVITCDTLTPGMCKLWCNANNYAYAGMTNGTTCGCSADISALTPVAASQCPTSCFSDKTVTCGGKAGSNAYDVWKSSGLIARRNHRRRVRLAHGSNRRAEAPMHFESEQDILYYLKRHSAE